MTAEEAGRRKESKGGSAKAGSAKRGGQKGAGKGSDEPAPDDAEGTAGDGELLDLARSILGLARTEIAARHDDHKARTERSRAVLHRARESADADLRPLLDEVFQHLDDDEASADEVVQTRDAILDDLAHDVASLASRLKQAGLQQHR